MARLLVMACAAAFAGALAPGGFVEAPNAYLASPTAILVEVGAPVFDGGDAVVNFEVQWDTRPDFAGGPGGEPLGRAVVPAADWRCADCVTQFDADDGVFTFTGKNDDGRALEAGAKFYVTFPDDNIAYLFTVRSGDLYATAINGAASQIFVEPGHARAASYGSAANGNHQFAGELRVVGARYRIEGLPVIHIVPGSPAHKAGMAGAFHNGRGEIELADIIIAINGKPIRSQDDYFSALESRKSGDYIEIETRRNDSKHQRILVPEQRVKEGLSVLSCCDKKINTFWKQSKQMHQAEAN